MVDMVVQKKTHWGKDATTWKGIIIRINRQIRDYKRGLAQFHSFRTLSNQNKVEPDPVRSLHYTRR